jgi:biotin synthase-related radical SAM superfamily protein
MDKETKAYLLSIGTIEMPRPIDFGRSSTAGPGAGGQSIFFKSGERLARLSVVPRSPLRLEQAGDEVAIFRGDEEIACGHLISPLLHCPEQAYLTISERCIYDCKFCAVPRLKGGVKTKEQVLQMVKEASASGRMKAISLTSGVEIDPQHEAARVADMVKDLKRFGVPIGVSVSPFRGVNNIMKEAGADEVKYNLETLDADLFARVCPGISFEEIWEALEDAVKIFGRNRVFSNVILGLGESDRIVMRGIDELTEMGVLPVLRPVYPHPLREGEMEMVRPDAERLLRLSTHLRRSLDRHGLRGDQALTGCYRCTGCDLVPHRDL